MRAYLRGVCIVWSLTFANMAFWGGNESPDRERRQSFALTTAALAIALRKEIK